MKYDFLPEKIKKVVLTLDLDKLNEIRIREGHFIIVKYDFKQYYLGNNSLTFDKNKAIRASNYDVSEIISTVTERSLYAHNERLKQGFLSYLDGVRIGIAGECVFEEKVVAVKNVKSLLIRFPCKTYPLTNDLKEIIYSKGEVFNTLIISPPGYGKTTLIRRIIKFLSETKSVLVIDERGELFDSEVSADYIRYSNKAYAFEKGTRSLAPEVIVADELISDEDIKTCQNIIKSGVNIIATMHGKDINKEIASKNIFDKYIILNNKEKPSEIKCVYDRHNIINNE